MSSWFERWRRRQYDLAHSVDADLVSDNRKRFKIAFLLMGLGALLAFLFSRLQVPGTLGKILFGVSFSCFLIGLVLAWWARAEDSFLSKPDRDEPPKLLK